MGYWLFMGLQRSKAETTTCPARAGESGADGVSIAPLTTPLFHLQVVVAGKADDEVPGQHVVVPQIAVDHHATDLAAHGRNAPG